MRAGTLRSVITIEKPVVVKDTYGATKTEWQKVITTRADVRQTNGNRQVQNDEIVYCYTKTFTVRLYHLIDESMRIIYKGQKFRILSIDSDLHKQSNTITTELVNE